MIVKQHSRSVVGSRYRFKPLASTTDITGGSGMGGDHGSISLNLGDMGQDGNMNRSLTLDMDENEAELIIKFLTEKLAWCEQIREAIRAASK